MTISMKSDGVDAGPVTTPGKTAVITGANAGIGLQTARRLAAAGMNLVLACRNPERGNAAAETIRQETGNENVAALRCDLASQQSIHDFASEFGSRYARLDVLINNAAMYAPRRKVNDDGIELQFASNYLGPFLLTRLLLDTLVASAPSRIVNVSTVNHFDVTLDLDDLQAETVYEPKVVHVRSKLALIMFTYELARRLDGTGVTANSLHPGVIATKLLGEVREVPPERRFTPEMGGDPLDVGARTPEYLATSPEVEGVTGRYFDDCRAVPSSAESRDEDKARRLWDISERLAGLAAA